MDENELMARLEKIEKAVTAKGHMMQDYSTVKMAILDLVNVVREIITQKRGKNA